MGEDALTVIEKIGLKAKKSFTILWLSRHPVLESQKAELKRLYGEDVKIVWWNKTVKNSGHVLDLMREKGADDVVAVLPLSIIDYLTKEGVYPLFSEMEYVGDKNSDAPAEYVDERTGRKYRFKRFVRIKAVIIMKEPVEPIINKNKTVEKDGMPF